MMADERRCPHCGTILDRVIVTPERVTMTQHYVKMFGYWQQDPQEIVISGGRTVSCWLCAGVLDDAHVPGDLLALIDF